MNRRDDNLSETAEREMTLRSRRAFLTMAGAGAAAYGGWRWLSSRPEEGGITWPYRRVLQANERVAGAFYSENRLAPVFPPEAAQRARVNGDVGLGDDLVPEKWRLTIRAPSNSGPPLRLSLSDIQALPKVEHVTALHCIEGWSVVSHWAGTRFSDFTKKYAPQSAQARYVSMQTPDQQYFVGLDMHSAYHPQTLLCYELNGAPLTQEHGAPVRLVIPVKYGIKNIKRIGTITYTNERPRDYWAEEGYDWYAGL